MASSGRGAVAILRASNVVARVNFSARLFITDPAGTEWELGGWGLGFGEGVWIEVEWVRQESRDEISGGGGGLGVGTHEPSSRH